MKSLLDITVLIQSISFSSDNISEKFKEAHNKACSDLQHTVAVVDLDDSMLEEMLEDIHEEIFLYKQQAIKAAEDNNEGLVQESILALKNKVAVSISRAYDEIIVKPSLSELDEAIDRFSEAQDDVTRLIREIEDVLSEVGISSNLSDTPEDELQSLIDDLEEGRGYYEDDLPRIVNEHIEAFVSLVSRVQLEVTQFFEQANKPIQEEIQPIQEEIQPVQEEIQPIQEEIQPIQEEIQNSTQAELDHFKVLELISRIMNDNSFAQKCFGLLKAVPTQEEN